MFDVCIIGGGVAGLMLAHSLPSSMRIAILTKNHTTVSNTSLAQGGIAVSLSTFDSPSSHAVDTMGASAFHANAKRVDILVNEGKELIEQLMAQGLPFDAKEDGTPNLGLEAAHSSRRILHAGGDQTGNLLMQYLLHKTEERVTHLPFHSVLECVIQNGSCTGVVVSNSTGQKQVISAKHVVLATGGIGQLYRQTSNSPVATGDGLSLAYHAGAVLEDLEFVQFHPTIFTLNGKSYGLISEAVRGEGAILVNRDGLRIMDDIHPLAELAPRDIVARTIEWHWQKNDSIYLDARHIQHFERKFPSIFMNCMKYGVNPLYDLIPVRPGAHFHMGGVQTNDVGATTIPNLYAIGEVASTGVHGANRLASNSLLEGLVFAARLAKTLTGNNTSIVERPSFVNGHQIANIDLSNMQQRMTEHVGILRAGDTLQSFVKDYPLRPFRLSDYMSKDVQNIHRYTACSLIASSASLRTESRGGHYRHDYPSISNEWTGKVIEYSIHGVAIQTREIESKETVK